MNVWYDSLPHPWKKSRLVHLKITHIEQENKNSPESTKPQFCWASKCYPQTITYPIYPHPNVCLSRMIFRTSRLMGYTPWNPQKSPNCFKEDHLHQTIIFRFKMFIFQGVSLPCFGSFSNPEMRSLHPRRTRFRWMTFQISNPKSRSDLTVMTLWWKKWYPSYIYIYKYMDISYRASIHIFV